ncbi:hypothetical protein EDB19DRAFT_1778724 [Suillus lakei]|nr:hypothetical protein EDB19DRAFT_1778724 [Suillus lakei]
MLWEWWPPLFLFGDSVSRSIEEGVVTYMLYDTWCPTYRLPVPSALLSEVFFRPEISSCTEPPPTTPSAVKSRGSYWFSCASSTTMRTCSSTYPDSAQAIEENNQTLSVQHDPSALLHLLRSGHRDAHAQRQVERIFVLKLALTLRGASNATSSHYDLPPEPEPESRDGGRGGFGTGDNGLGPLDASLPGENSSLGPSGSTGEDEQDSGVHL